MLYTNYYTQGHSGDSNSNSNETKEEHIEGGYLVHGGALPLGNNVKTQQWVNLKPGTEKLAENLKVKNINLQT